MLCYMPSTFGTEGFTLRGKDMNYCSPCNMPPYVKGTCYIFLNCSCLTNWEVKYVSLFAVLWSLKFYLLSNVWSLFVLSSACSSVIHKDSVGILFPSRYHGQSPVNAKSGNVINSRISALGVNKQDYSKKSVFRGIFVKSAVPTMH